MPQLNKRQQEWAARVQALANASGITDANVVAAVIGGLLYRTHMDPTFKDPDGRGIAGLPASGDAGTGIDPTNPDDAIQMLLGAVNSSPDAPAQAVAQALFNGNEDAQTRDAAKIDEIASTIIGNIGPDGSQDAENFSDMMSPRHRFRHALAANDHAGVQSVLDEMITNRVDKRVSDGRQQPNQPNT